MCCSKHTCLFLRLFSVASVAWMSLRRKIINSSRVYLTEFGLLKVETAPMYDGRLGLVDAWQNSPGTANLTRILCLQGLSCGYTRLPGAVALCFPLHSAMPAAHLRLCLQTNKLGPLPVLLHWPVGCRTSACITAVVKPHPAVRQPIATLHRLKRSSTR